MGAPSWLGKTWVRRSALLLVQLGLAGALVALIVPRVWTPVRSYDTLQPVATTVQQVPARLGASTWEQLALPVPAAGVQTVAVSPANAALWLVCTAHLDLSTPGGYVTGQPMTLWRTTDAGAHWTRYSATSAVGTSCVFSIAPDNPQRITFEVARTDVQPCSSEQWYLSNDSGASWRPLPPHRSAAPNGTFGWCDLHATAHHLYLAYSYESSQTPQSAILERSDDDGAHWTRADQGLGENAMFFMPAVGPDDTLVMPVVHNWGVANGRTATELWRSTDVGQTWRLQSSLPEYPGTIMLTAPARPGLRWPSATHPFYALEAEQIPSSLYREGVLASGDGVRWSSLPVLPVPGVSAERRGILQALAALPDGRLAIWGTDPEMGLPQTSAQAADRFWLWLWDPSAGEWKVVSDPLAVSASEGCGLCWSAQTATDTQGGVWLYVARKDVITGDPLRMFRIQVA